MAECFASNKKQVEKNILPLDYNLIDEHQQVDSSVLKCLQNGVYFTSTFHCGGNSDRIKSIDLVTYNGKIVIPQTLQMRLLKWYHAQLLHPGKERTEETN